MKIPTEASVGEICGDQKAARSCYLTFFKESLRSQPALLIEPGCDLRSEIDLECLSTVEEISKEMLPGRHIVCISSQLPQGQRNELLTFLKKNVDVFA